jgi:hypothetical protein
MNFFHVKLLLWLRRFSHFSMTYLTSTQDSVVATGWVLQTAPDVNGNSQMKISPNMSAQRIVDGVFGCVISEKLRISALTPLRFLVSFLGQDNYPSSASLGQLGGHF